MLRKTHPQVTPNISITRSSYEMLWMLWVWVELVRIQYTEPTKAFGAAVFAAAAPTIARHECNNDNSRDCGDFRKTMFVSVSEQFENHKAKYHIPVWMKNI